MHAYGETPLFTLEQIVQKCGIKSADSVLELGCGRARTCFWLALVHKVKTIGIDFVPEFIQKAEKVRARYQVDNLQLIEGDFLKDPLPHATVVYLHGSIMTDEEIVQLIRQLKHYPAKTKVITVSFPLKDFTGGKKFRILNSFSAHFSWGKAEVYCQEMSA